MSRTNFCANCGARLVRRGWFAWSNGGRCSDCTNRLGRAGVKPLALVSVVAIAAFAFGRYLRPAPPPLIIHRAANSPLSDLPVNYQAFPETNASPANASTSEANAADDIVYICGARTKKGTPCRRRVHVAGERCYQHKGMPAMVPLDKLTIKPDAAKK